jgi:SAM-dependent methyltransferase
VEVRGTAWKQEHVVEAYIEERRTLLPLFDVQEELVRRLLTRGGRRVERFLDLGAGDGGFAALLTELFPDSTGVLVDFSDPMLAAAGTRGEERWEIVRGDLSDPAWRDRVPDGRYDAVVSRFAIHHLTDARKRALYAEAFALLAPGGVFLNWEHVETGGLAEGMFDEYWRERMLAAAREDGDSRPPEEILAAYDDAADDDILCEPETQCEWLREIGFDQVGTYFKLPGLAIFGGVKKSEAAAVGGRTGL